MNAYKSILAEADRLANARNADVIKLCFESQASQDNMKLSVVEEDQICDSRSKFAQQAINYCTNFLFDVLDAWYYGVNISLRIDYETFFAEESVDIGTRCDILIALEYAQMFLRRHATHREANVVFLGYDEINKFKEYLEHDLSQFYYSFKDIPVPAWCRLALSKPFSEKSRFSFSTLENERSVLRQIVMRNIANTEFV